MNLRLLRIKRLLLMESINTLFIQVQLRSRSAARAFPYSRPVSIPDFASANRTTCSFFIYSHSCPFSQPDPCRLAVHSIRWIYFKSSDVNTKFLIENKKPLELCVNKPC